MIVMLRREDMMRSFFAVFKREFSSLFLSPVAYVTAVVFVAASAWTFLQALKANVGADESLVMLLLVSIMIWVPILVTVVCMRLFAEEKRSGTIESLMTVSVSELSVVMGKYLSALLFVWMVIAPAVSMIYLLAYISPGIESVDNYALAGGAVILGLITICCVAIGLLVSLLTRNQIVAAICCFAAICTPFFLKSLVGTIPFISDGVVEYLSVEVHLLTFSTGGLSLQVAVLYLSVALLMLFASVRVLESRRWL